MSKPLTSCSSTSRAHMSNLQRFLDSVTPIINSSSCDKDCNSLEDIRLKDIWENYEEWSACGVGTSVELENGEQVIQYFVPYLSAIQIYIKKSSPTLRESIEEPTFPSRNFLSSKFSCGKDHSVAFGDRSETQSNELTVPVEEIHFQFYENSLPYNRAPFADKISELSASHHSLMRLRVHDIAPASWMAVAWYPIYHIPAKGRIKDLSTCFLTFHALSHSFRDVVDFHVKGFGDKSKQSGGIALTPFGLASYKMHGNIWNNPATGDEERLKDLLSAACSWLKQLKAPHHDFYFFNLFSVVK